MAELLEGFAAWIALGVETAAAVLIASGAVEALHATFRPQPHETLGRKRLVWVRFAGWLALALEFLLAADIVRTAISPSWEEIGQLGAIAVIRTFLNYFLQRDIREIAELEVPAASEAGIAHTVRAEA